MKRYESIFVLDNNTDKDVLVEGYIEKIKSYGAEIVKVDRWGKKRFSYEIKKRQYGDYTCVEYMAAEKTIAEIERDFRLSEEVLRFMTYNITKAMLKQRDITAAKAGQPEVK